MSALPIEKVSDEAKCDDTADIRMETWDLSFNPTSCPQGLGIRGAPELNWWPASVQRRDEPEGRPAIPLLPSTSSASCRAWLTIGGRNSTWQIKMEKAFLHQPRTSLSPCPLQRKRKTSAEVAPCALTQREGAAGAWWEEETCSRATMTAVTICPVSLSFSGRG